MRLTQRTFLVIILLIGVLSTSMVGLKLTDNDYQKAIAIAEKKFSGFHINREDYKLIKIENDIVNNSDGWKFTYLRKSCLSKEGRRSCKGGEVYLLINIKTENATIGLGE